MKKNILVPFLTVLICALVLVGLNAGLSGVAASKAEAELTAKMQVILPGSETFTEEEYTGDDANIRRVFAAENGYVIEVATNGYAGEITMLVGVDKDGKVTGLQVRDMEETFGLGGEALTDHEFLRQYLQTSGEAEVGVNVDAISGATVTSKAITRCVNSAVAYVTGADASSGATS